MGLGGLDVFDIDGVTSHNLPNQFYREEDVAQFKVDALHDIIQQFTGENIEVHREMYTDQELNSTVIVATDSMSSRKLVWEQFKQQGKCHDYIEARMGAELGIIYTIKGYPILTPNDTEFYEETLYEDKDVPPLKCTERAIIYNILMISSLICRAYKSIIDPEHTFPKEIIFNMKYMDVVSYMIRQ